MTVCVSIARMPPPVTRSKDLRFADTFQKQLRQLVASLTDLRKAPLVEEEYHGLVLLSADATVDTMRALLSGSLTATRPKLGTEARHQWPICLQLHARVLPEFIDVVDDPASRVMTAKVSSVSYNMDEEAVPAQSVNLITSGRLQNYLIGREPVRDFSQSNGHGRAGITAGPTPAISVPK